MILIIVSLVLWSIVLHELGHLLYFKWFAKRDVSIAYSIDRGFVVGSSCDYIGLSKIQKFELYFAGIFLGLMPLVIASIFNIIFTITIPIYLMGCRGDVAKIWRLIRHEC